MQEFIPLLTAIGVNALAVALIAVVYVLYIKAKEDERYTFIFELVAAAEQMHRDQAGKERLAWVLAQAKQRFPRLDTDLLTVIIEAAVYRLNQEQGKAAPANTGYVSDRQWEDGMNAGAPSSVYGKEARNE